MSGYAPGDTVYGRDGQEAEFVAKVGGEYVVRPIYEDDEGPQVSGVETWPAAFRTPPAPRVDEKTAAAEKRLQEITAQVREMEAAKRTLDVEEKNRLDRIKRHEELAELDRYLAGEITHYVATHAYYPTVEIIPIGETLSDHASANGYGLLQLYPNRKWDKKIFWSVTYRIRNMGYDNSRTEIVIPCCGEEAAQAKAKEVLSSILNKYKADAEAKKPLAYAAMLVACCQKFSVEVPQWLSGEIKARALSDAADVLEKSRKQLLEAEQAMAALSGSAA